MAVCGLQRGGLLGGQPADGLPEHHAGHLTQVVPCPRGHVRATSLTAERMAGTLTPRKSRSLLRYRLACPARSASASGSIAAITAAAAVSGSKDGLLAGPLLTGPRYRAGDGRLGACHGRTA